MANSKNLKNIADRADKKEIQSKGGKASGKARREKKAIRERLAAMMELSATDPAALQALKTVGQEQGTIWDATAAAIVAGAVNGSPQHIKLLMELMGETGDERRANNKDAREQRLLELKEKQFAMTGTLDGAILPPVVVRMENGRPVVSGGAPNQIVLVDDLDD